MAPIICLLKDSVNTLNSPFYETAVRAVCLLDLMDVVALPIFNHVGAGPAYYPDIDPFVKPIPCKWYVISHSRLLSLLFYPLPLTCIMSLQRCGWDKSIL